MSIHLLPLSSFVSSFLSLSHGCAVMHWIFGWKGLGTGLWVHPGHTHIHSTKQYFWELGGVGGCYGAKGFISSKNLCISTHGYQTTCSLSVWLFFSICVVYSLYMSITSTQTCCMHSDKQGTWMNGVEKVYVRKKEKVVGVCTFLGLCLISLCTWSYSEKAHSRGFGEALQKQQALWQWSRRG